MKSSYLQLAAVSPEAEESHGVSAEGHGDSAHGLTEETHVADGHHGESVGLPQLDPAGSLFVSQLFWLAICFGFLYILMSRVALPRIATVIEERRDKIALDLDKAAEFRAKIDAAIEAYQTALAEARTKAHQTVEETRRRANLEMDQKRKASEAQIDARLREAEDRINATKEAALANVRDVASEVATVVLGRLHGDQISANAIEAAVEEEMSAVASR